MPKSISSYIRSVGFLKKIAHWLLVPENEYRPRAWVKAVANPLVHSVGRHVIIRKTVRQDIFPYNDFYVGDSSLIEDFSTINNGVGEVTIGIKTIIGVGNVIIGPVKIGSNVMLAQHVVISGMNHQYEDISVPPSEQPVSRKKIVIGDNVWIGANSVVTAGVEIGRHSVVGAGSVVSMNIPEYTVAVGNPARIIKKYNTETGVWEKVA